MLFRRFPVIKSICIVLVATVSVVAIVPPFIFVIEFIYNFLAEFIGADGAFKSGDNLQNIFIGIFAALLSLVGVFLNQHNITKAQLRQKRENTIRVLLENRSSEYFQEQMFIVQYHFPPGTVVRLDDYRKYLLAESEEKRRVAEAVTNTLNFYEFLASGAREEIFDREIIRENIRSALCGLVYDMHDLIAEFRKDNNKIFEHLVALYLEWADRDAIGVEWDNGVEAKLALPADISRHGNTA